MRDLKKMDVFTRLILQILFKIYLNFMLEGILKQVILTIFKHLKIILKNFYRKKFLRQHEIYIFSLVTVNIYKKNKLFKKRLYSMKSKNK